MQISGLLAFVEKKKKKKYLATRGLYPNSSNRQFSCVPPQGAGQVLPICHRPRCSLMSFTQSTSLIYIIFLIQWAFELVQLCVIFNHYFLGNWPCKTITSLIHKGGWTLKRTGFGLSCSGLSCKTRRTKNTLDCPAETLGSLIYPQYLRLLKM